VYSKLNLNCVESSADHAACSFSSQAKSSSYRNLIRSRTWVHQNTCLPS